LIYTSIDRFDLAFVTKELAGRLQEPTMAEWKQLEWVAKYLIGREGAVSVFEVDLTKSPEFVEAFADADWGGSLRTRKSTSGGVIMWCGVVLTHYSRNQATYSLSSGESELYGSISASSEGLFVVSLLTDMHYGVMARLWTDSTACLGLLQKPGLSRPMRHVQIKFLYLQGLVLDKVLVAKKVDGKKNCADLGTKFVTHEMLTTLLPLLNTFLVSYEEAMADVAHHKKVVTQGGQ